MKQKNNLYVVYALTIALLMVLAACSGANEPVPAPTAEEVAVPTVTDSPATAVEAESTEIPVEEENSGDQNSNSDSATEVASNTESQDDYPGPNPEQNEATESATKKDYPAPDDPLESVTSESEESEKPEGYVGPTPTPSFPIGPDFNIDKPVEPGATTVSGTGPAGLPLRLINVSEMGPLIAETVIDEDGTFTFEFETPLDDQISIGLKIGDLRDVDNEEGWTYDDFRVSPCYYERAFVGVLLDLASIAQAGKGCSAHEQK